jgi:hypothetical protein
MAPSTDRQQFREVLAGLASKTLTKIPTLNGRVAKACKLVLGGDVALAADGTAQVGSLTDPRRTYLVGHGACECQDYDRAPEHLCAHRLSVGFLRKVQELLPVAPAEATVAAPVAPAALPEAPASVNCHIMLEGRQVQVTLRDTDEQQLLKRLTAVLRQYPVLPSANAKNQRSASSETPDKGQPDWCPIHGCAMQENHKDGRTWHSHKTADGWCKGKVRRP